MPDHETANHRDGGYRDRTGDLLLAKAQHTVHQGDANGTPSGSDPGSAAAAATRHRTPAESTSETLHALLGPSRQDQFEAQEICRDLGVSLDGPIVRFLALGISAARALHVEAMQINDAWAALERHARALDRSEAAHALRVRADQAAGQQRHVRRAVHA